MDRADGELARLTGKITPGGHRYDMFCDVTVSSLFFIGCAIGLRDSYFGYWMILMWAIGTARVFAAQIYAEKIDQMTDDTGDKSYADIWGFDFDDVLYLFAPIVWLGWQMPFVVGASVGAPAFALLPWYKCRKRLQEV
jgi:archaetidylinositol phosphate synthase